MKLIVQLKVLLAAGQAAALLQTTERFNAACNAAAKVAFATRTAGKVRLQHFAYRRLRTEFGLSAQTAVRAIAKACEAYKRDKRTCPAFRPHGAMPYDERILSYKPGSRVSLLTLNGRIIVPIVFGAHCPGWQQARRGQADLVYRDRTFYLLQPVDVPQAPARAVQGWLGVDLGLANLATDGEAHSGKQINGLRRRYHGVSKRLVAKAEGTGRGIALEEFRGIRDRITARKAHRRALSSWSFGQLRQFIEYKAALCRIPVRTVDPKYASQTCPSCGAVDKRNRPSQASFAYLGGEFGTPADAVAAENIRRAAVM